MVNSKFKQCFELQVTSEPELEMLHFVPKRTRTAKNAKMSQRLLTSQKFRLKLTGRLSHCVSPRERERETEREREINVTNLQLRFPAASFPSRLYPLHKLCKR